MTTNEGALLAILFFLIVLVGGVYLCAGKLEAIRRILKGEK